MYDHSVGIYQAAQQDVNIFDAYCQVFLGIEYTAWNTMHLLIENKFSQEIDHLGERCIRTDYKENELFLTDGILMEFCCLIR